jgi:hypothetical protein
MPAPRRLPGVRIDAAPPPPAEALPRMDVAVLVGFAARGPAHIPVAVESVAGYEAVFGADAPLAYDAERGEPVPAYLGAAVRGFFANGGRRCWVIRVARTADLETRWCQAVGRSVDLADTAVANRFEAPGVLALSKGGAALDPAAVQARSLGSWSDGLRMQTALTQTSFELSICEKPTVGTDNHFAFLTAAALQVGDLIELAATGADGIQRYATIDAVKSRNGLPARKVEATLRAAFQPLAKPPGEPGEAHIQGIPAAAKSATWRQTADHSRIALQFELPVSTGPVVGQWIAWRADGKTVWLRIDHLNSTAIPDNSLNHKLEASGPAWLEIAPSDTLLSAPAPTRAAALTLDLRVLSGQADMARLTGVGLTPGHRDAWWRQISDAAFYTPPDGLTGAPARAQTATSSTRFPLAAGDSEINGNSPLAWIPLGVTALFGAAVGPLPQAATPLQRDGLSRFDAELFLDPELAPLNANQVIEQADAIRFFAQQPREPLGIHAALSIGTGGMYNEASLIAVPDALHPGWTKRGLDDLKPPPLSPFKPPAHWRTHRGPCAAIADGENLTEPDFGRFLDCGTRKLAAPEWMNPPKAVPSGVFRLQWQSGESEAEYLLEQSSRADFSDARTIYRGAAAQFDLSADREGIFYFRVTALSGEERSAPSPTLPVQVRDDAWRALTPAEFGDSGAVELRRVQRALLRLAAASGELFAVLGLPRHYRAADAIRHALALRAERPDAAQAFGFNERRALSYGALYHPWIVSPAPRLPGSAPLSTIAQRAYPPDGIAIGVLAARASRRGAWIAPANEPFREVSALAPPIEPGAWQALQDAQVNLIRADARGFLALAADTLADQPELRPINVRRLLILLRRLALRRGASYVFEPNGDVLRRAVERGFSLLLADLFRRGAFAGATEAQSFQVVAGDDINRPSDRDAGRFFVELKVAPALPLRFLAVRLVQSGERFTVEEA